jgi:hypothetical protein
MCPMAVKFSILKVVILMKPAAKMSKMFPMGLLGISCIVSCMVSNIWSAIVLMKSSYISYGRVCLVDCKNSHCQCVGSQLSHHRLIKP